MAEKSPESRKPMAGRNILTEFKMLRWFVVLWIGVVLAWGLLIPSGARPSFPGSKVLMAALIVLQGFVYWLILKPGMKKNFLAVLLIVQTGMFIVTGLISLHMAVSLCLYWTLAGVTILSLRQVRLAILAGLAFFAAGIPLFLFYSRFIEIGTVMWIYVPVALFLFIAIVLFDQQANAYARTQNLLNELAESHRQLEAYALQVEELTLTNERQRMARELHDTLAQGLAGIILQLEAADSHLGSGKTERARTIIRQSMARARAALAESRQAIDQLRKDSSPAPEQLSTAIQEEIERFSTSTGIPVTFHLDGYAPIPFPQRDCACRAVAEALLNIARHAGASQVLVSLVEASGQLTIEIRDNGAGFNPASRIGQVGHYGLLGLRERARLLGGTLEVNSVPQQGSSIHLCLPLKIEVEDD